MKSLIKDHHHHSLSVTVKEVPPPKLENDHDVLIRVSIAGICRTDVDVAEGRIPSPVPLILGHEFSGVIAEVGKKVQRLKKGDRVAVNPLIPCGQCSFCKSADTDLCQESQFLGLDRDGAFSEFIVVPEGSVLTLNPTLSMKEAAYMEPVAASLAVLKAGIAPSQKGLIYGDNRISRLTLKILQAYGFQDVSIFDLSLNSFSPESHSYDFMIETLATQEVMADIVRAIKPRGTIVLKSRQAKPVSIQFSQIIKKEPTFVAVKYGSFQESLDLMASKKIQVNDLFGETYPIENFREAFATSNKPDALKLFFQF